MTETTLGVVLAGGLALRMGGGDKTLRAVGGEAVLARLAARLLPQVTGLILNANGDPARFGGFGLPVAPDDVPDRPGPLAGVLAGLDWAARFAPDVHWIVTMPGDAPFLPEDLVARLHGGRGGAVLACAASGGRTHPVAALWPVALRHDLRRALTEEGVRKVGAYLGRHGAAVVEWPVGRVDPFFNVNTPADLADADRLAAG